MRSKSRTCAWAVPRHSSRPHRKISRRKAQELLKKSARAMAARAGPARSKRNVLKYMSIASTGVRDAERSRFFIRRLLLDVHALQVRTHRPQRLLTEEVGHLRHVHAPVAHR